MGENRSSRILLEHQIISLLGLMLEGLIKHQHFLVEWVVMHLQGQVFNGKLFDTP